MRHTIFGCLLVAGIALTGTQPYALASLDTTPPNTTPTEPTTPTTTPTTTTPPTTTPTTTTPTTTETVTIKTTQGTDGEFLTDSAGHSLYMFELDNPGKSNCTGACSKAWPAVTVPTAQSSVTTMGNVVATLVGSPIVRDDGTYQVIYNSLPLYTFVGDKTPGDSNGQGQKSFGGTWYLVKADGTKLMPATPPATTPTQPPTGSSGGGTSPTGH